MDLDSVADELYALPLSEFTSMRNERAKQAKAAGDRSLATEIQQLPKPTTSAWLVNKLARELAADLEPLIALGRDLREASSNISGDELRALTRQRHQVVHALVQQARKLAFADGQRVSEDVANQVRQTLEASLADPEVADGVLSGRITRAAEYAGFGEPTGITWQGRPRRRTRPSTSTTRERSAEVADLDARRRESAERALAEAAARLQAAQADRAAAENESERVAGEVRDAEDEAERLRTALAAAEERATAAAAAGATTRERLEQTAKTTREAERTHAEATARLAELDR